jgi:selenide, water dikinase
MLRASDADATLDPEAIPALEGALSLLGRGITSSLHADNVAALSALGPDEAAQTSPLAALLIDPQTAGGLLAGVPAERAAACVAELRRLDYDAAEIGFVEPANSDQPRVHLGRRIAETLPERVAAK